MASPLFPEGQGGDGPAFAHPGRLRRAAESAALIHLIKEDRGYQLHQAVQAVKYDLSSNDSAVFRFQDGTVDLAAKVKRSSFEGWIREELKQIEICLDTLLKETGADAKKIDAVFLTGGSSFVPAVRKIFTDRFGEQRIRTGNEFTSVAWGLGARRVQKPGSLARDSSLLEMVLPTQTGLRAVQAPPGGYPGEILVEVKIKVTDRKRKSQWTQVEVHSSF